LSSSLADHFSLRELGELTLRLSMFHRIQGSSGLESAASWISDVLIDSGLEVRVRRYRYEEMKYPKPVAGWDPVSGFAELSSPVKERITDLSWAWTAVAAHSPSGDFEGRAVILDEDTVWEVLDLEGKVVVVSAKLKRLYPIMSERGAEAILFYRDDLPPTAVPYVGLFLSPEEASAYRTPALSIPRLWVEKIGRWLASGKEVIIKGEVRSTWRERSYAPVVEVTIGDKPAEYHLVAHYCHPGGTVNDNASGAGALMELALAINRAIRSGSLTLRNHSLRIVLVPEYFGTIPYLMERAAEGASIKAAINLDMVGGNPKKTESVLNVIRPPMLLTSAIEAAGFIEVSKALRSHPLLHVEPRSYSVGSDHDVYVINGVPAVMINEWPDIRYHSSADWADAFDPRISRAIALAAFSAIERASSSSLTPEEQLAYYLRILSRDIAEAAEKGQDVFQAVLSMYCRYVLPRVPDIFQLSIARNYCRYPAGGKFVRVRRVYPPVSLSYHLSKAERLRYLKWIRDKEWVGTAASLILVYGRKTASVESLRHELMGEMKRRISVKEVTTLLKFLEAAGLVELM